MTSTLRRPFIGIAAILIFGIISLIGTPASAQQATPGASPVAMAAGHPAHIHDGTCEALGAIVYPLNDVTGGAESAAGAIAVELSVTRVEASLADILGAPHAINIHESAENIGNYIACGNVVGTPNGADLFIGVGELNDSGYAGIAWLHDNGDGTTTVSVFIAEKLSGGAAAAPMASPVASPVA
jgi:hypothetical protein